MLKLLILIFKISIIVCLNYDILQSMNITNIAHQAYLIERFYKRDLVSCLVECNVEDFCITAKYDENKQNCFLYKRYFQPSELTMVMSPKIAPLYIQTCQGIFVSNGEVCLQKGRSLKQILKTYQLRIGFNKYGENTMGVIHSVGSLQTKTKTLNLAMDYTAKRVAIFDEYWNFTEYKSLYINPAHCLVVETDVYITTDVNIIKTDSEFIVMKNFTSSKVYRGIGYSKLNNTVLAVCYGLRQIQVFTRNLTILDTLTLTDHRPYSIAAYDEHWFIGTEQSKLLMVKNKVIFKTISLNVVSCVNNIIVDDYGYIALLTDSGKKIHLFNKNGVNLNISMAINPSSLFITLDTSGRLIVGYHYNVRIYY